MLGAELEDALADGVAEKWGFDGPELVERLRRMPWSRLMAIGDAFERMWALTGKEPTLGYTERLIRVGLLAGDPIPTEEA